MRPHHLSLSFIRTMTVGSGVTPDLLTQAIPKDREALAGLRPKPLTAGGELHPAPRTRRRNIRRQYEISAVFRWRQDLRDASPAKHGHRGFDCRHRDD